jgi:titin
VRNIKSETFNELVTIPRGMPPGRYLCNTYTRDIVGRGGYKWGITSFVITRTSGNHDDQGPIFSEIVWGPAVVDVGSSDSVAKLNFTVSDASGIEIVNLMCKLGESEFSVNIENNFGRWRYVVNTRSSQVVSYHPISNNRSLTFDGEIVLPVGQNPGRYTCMTHTFDTLRNEGFIANGTFLDIYRTPAGQPSAPIAVQLVANRPTVATLEWSPPVVLGSPSMYAYVTEISTDGTSWKALANGATTETSLEVKNLKPGTRYWLRVRGENGGTLGQSTRYMNLNWATTSFTTPLAVVPDPPTSLQISQVKANSFKLDWTVPIYSGGRNISNFSVEVSTDNGETWRSAKAKASTSKSLTVTGAAPVTRYLIRVAAVNVIGSSEYLTGEVSTLATVPSAPRSLAISNLDTTSLLLSWMIPASNGGADITDYKVEFAVGNSNTWTEITHEVSNNLGFDVTGLSPNRAYRFRVSGINSYGRGPTSNIVSATTLVSLPAEPTNVAASRATATTASLAWRAPTNTGGAALSDYRVEISRDGGTNWSTVSKRASNSTSLALTGLAPSTTYQVRVAAVNARGAGPTVVGSLTTLVGPPSAPANLRSSDVTGTTATIAWDLPASNGGSAITSYRVEVSSNCSSYTTLSRTASNSLAQSVTNLKPGLRYCFRVSTINSVGISPASTVLQLTTVGNAPNAPTALSVRASATQVTLSWRAATVTGGGPVRNYIVEYSRDSGENWISVVKPVSTSTSIAIRNLTRSTAYLFRVYAVNDSGQSQASANLAVTTPAR